MPQVFCPHSRLSVVGYPLLAPLKMGAGLVFCADMVAAFEVCSGAPFVVLISMLGGYC